MNFLSPKSKLPSSAQAAGKTVIFVAGVGDPCKNNSSTAIMTGNLLVALKECGCKVIFCAVYEQNGTPENIREYYGKIVDTIILVPSSFNFTKYTGKYYQAWGMLKGIIFPPDYHCRRLLQDIVFSGDTILISHTPSLEGAIVARQIKRMLPDCLYYQYWSDPYALAGILPENFNCKRWLSYLIEAKILRWADRVIYGTATLAYFQRRLFPFYKQKIRYIDISHSAGEKTVETKTPYTFGYFGGYISRYRDINKIYQVVAKHPEWSMLICGIGIPPLESCANITVMDRVPQAQIGNYEKQTAIHLTVLNFNNIQIPGKIFYKTHQNITILVVLDGKYKDFIHQYLKQFERFEFCENNEADIEAALKRITAPGYRCLSGKQELVSPAQVAADLLAGGKLCQ